MAVRECHGVYIFRFWGATRRLSEKARFFIFWGSPMLRGPHGMAVREVAWYIFRFWGHMGGGGLKEKARFLGPHTAAV